ncbi:unnamed protein product [Blepharisma stoltei]|uniref:Maturase K n=1 Tax=Blepharisma stoltei TaxID=1481888 RepID=A0AAU9KFH6_9CILI|nr:unnamed protein product [Blepharisma stoltei]
MYRNYHFDISKIFILVAPLETRLFLHIGIMIFRNCISSPYFKLQKQFILYFDSNWSDTCLGLCDRRFNLTERKLKFEQLQLWLKSWPLWLCSWDYHYEFSEEWLVSLRFFLKYHTEFYFKNLFYSKFWDFEKYILSFGNS